MVPGPRPNLCPHCRQTVNVRACHTAMVDVTHDGHRLSFQGTQMIAHGKHVQQGLTRMLIDAVTRIQNGPRKCFASM